MSGEEAEVGSVDEGLHDSDLDFAVVGIGTSAGGLSAMTRFFQNVPENPGMAFVVVMHLSPSHRSHASEILQRSTTLPVTQVVGPTRIACNHVYVIPPAKQLTMNDGHLYLADLTRTTGRHGAIISSSAPWPTCIRRTRSALCCRAPATTAPSA